MVTRFLVSLIAAALVVFAGSEALGSAIAPQQLKIIATVVAIRTPPRPPRRATQKPFSACPTKAACASGL